MRACVRACVCACACVCVCVCVHTSYTYVCSPTTTTNQPDRKILHKFASLVESEQRRARLSRREHDGSMLTSSSTARKANVPSQYHIKTQTRIVSTRRLQYALIEGNASQEGLPLIFPFFELTYMCVCGLFIGARGVDAAR